MTVLKALKKMFGKSEAEQLAPSSSAPSHTPSSRTDGHQPGRTAAVAAPKHTPANTPAAEPVAEKPRSETPKPAQPRRERAPKPPVVAWKLEDFVVEPQE